jgi:uncharacterized Fe-S radical SAM superfamily protein PflX
MLSRVEWWSASDLSKDRSTSIFRVKQSTLLKLCGPEYDLTKRRQLKNDTPKRLAALLCEPQSLYANTVILRGSRPVPAKRSAVSTALTAFKLRYPEKTNKKIPRVWELNTLLQSTYTLRFIRTGLNVYYGEWMGKNDRLANRQLWCRTQRNISAGTDHLAKQHSQQNLDAQIHTSITRQKPIWSIKCLENTQSVALTCR